MASKKNDIVGISITPNVGIEMALMDKDSLSVIKYANRPIDYNYLQRNFTDFDQIERAIKELFSQLDISNKSDVVLTLPTTEIKTYELPAAIDGAGVENAILSEVEQSFFFRNQEALVRWVELKNPSVGNKKYLYTAFQATTISLLKETLTGLGCNLIGIETSFASLLKALNVLNYSEIQQNDNWNLVIIQPTSCCILNMQGEDILDIVDAPLAVKSFGEEEVYDVLAEKINTQLYEYTNSSSTLIVSKVDEVSAERLSGIINFNNKKSFIENNSYASGEPTLFSVDYSVLPQYKHQISLEIIGTVAYNYKKYAIRFNFTDTKEVADSSTVLIGGKEYPEKTIIAIYGMIMAFFLALTLGVYLGVPQIKATFDSKKGGIDSQITTLDNEIKSLKKSNEALEDDNSKLVAIPTANEKEYEYYQFLGRYAPNTLWVTRYFTDNTGSLGIQGSAATIDDIRKFMIGIASTKEPGVNLSKLKMSDQDSYYDFEISNSAFKSAGGFESLNPTGESADNKEKEADNALKNVADIPAQDAPPVENLPTDAAKK